MVAISLPADPPPPPPPRDPMSQKVIIQLFQNMVMLHIKFMFMLHIKFIGITKCSNMVA